MDLHDLISILQELADKFPPGTLRCAQIDSDGFINAIEGLSIVEKNSTTCIKYSFEKDDYDTYISEDNFLVLI